MSQSRLELVWWWNPHPEDAIGTWWGQLAGSLHRLSIVIDYLAALPGRKETEGAVKELTYHLENYYARVYELRERAVGLAEKIVGKKLGTAKDPKKRASAMADIPELYRDSLAPFFSLLDAIDDDIRVRNDHTHQQFLDVQLVTYEDTIFDPIDALADARHAGKERPLTQIVRQEIARLAERYRLKASHVLKETQRFLEATEFYLSLSQASQPGESKEPIE